MSTSDKLVENPSKELQRAIAAAINHANDHRRQNPGRGDEDLAVEHLFDVGGEEASITIRVVPGQEPELTVNRPNPDDPHGVWGVEARPG